MTLDEAILHCEEVMMENLKKTENRNCDDPVAHNCFECAEEHRQLVEWLKELKQSREQTRWIPVSERLPEDGEDVLVYIERNAWDEDGLKFKKKCIDIGWQIDGRWHCDGCNGVVGIAWMPLPKPYKAESEGSDADND